MGKEFYNIQSITTKAFGDNVELLSSIDELFELEMAWLEFNMNSNK